MTPPDNKAVACGKRISPFSITASSSETAVRQALKEFLAALDELNLDTDELGTIELVLAETLNNIVEHAYPQTQTSGPIELNCRHQTDGLHIEIRDNGAEMPDGKLPPGMLAPIEGPEDDLPEGGFGWFLIQHLAKDLVYTRLEDENLLKLRLAVGL